MARQIFSKAALEKLSTPEKLDQLIKIVSVKSWLVLATIGLLLGTAIFWSISGRIKTKLSATGVLLGGEVYNIVSNTNGQLLDLKANIGETNHCTSRATRPCPTHSRSEGVSRGEAI